jgi:IS30 family transposase
VNKTRKKLTRSQRETIDRMHKSGDDSKTIAKVVLVHRSSIERELKNNRSPSGAYEAQAAHAIAMARKARGPVKLKGELLASVLALLLRRQSPAEICERLRRIDPGKTVCAETIYGHVIDEAARGGGLYRFLPLRRRGRKRRRTKRVKHGPIPDRVDIRERPPEVAALQELGHYEGDTVHGTTGAVITLVERVSGYTLVWRVANLRKKTVADAIIRMMRGHLVRSITFDNGSEFAAHRRIARSLRTKCYFATPGRPCERGRNENKNRQLRMLHPKRKTAYRHMRAVEVRRAQDRLNEKLRKGLGWKCANDFLPELKFHGPPQARYAA